MPCDNCCDRRFVAALLALENPNASYSSGRPSVLVVVVFSCGIVFGYEMLGRLFATVPNVDVPNRSSSWIVEYFRGRVDDFTLLLDGNRIIEHR